MTTPVTMLRSVLTQWAKTMIVLCTDGGANDGKGVEVTGTSGGSVNVNLTGGAVGGSTVAQGDPNAGGEDAWPTQTRPSTAVSSAALEPSHVLKASAGTFRSVFVQIDASAPDGLYYVQLLTGSATVPPDGAVTWLRPPIAVLHTNGIPDNVTFDEGDAGILFTVGCTACLSTTRDTKTIAGAYCFFSGSVL